MSEELNITPEAAAPTESMDDYAAELEASFKQIHEGDILTGTVIGVSESEITLDLKYYTEGIIRPEDFTSDPAFNLKEDVHVGDEILRNRDPQRRRRRPHSALLQGSE